MNLQHDRIRALCSALKLDQMGTIWPVIAARTAEQDASLADFLEQLLISEQDARHERTRQTLLNLATLPAIKTLEQFDFTFATGAPRAQIQELASLSFIERAQEPSGQCLGLSCGHGRHKDTLHHCCRSDVATRDGTSTGPSQTVLQSGCAGTEALGGGRDRLSALRS